jgi:DNA-binding beta-propeller fold protein YncE
LAEHLPMRWCSHTRGIAAILALALLVVLGLSSRVAADRLDTTTAVPAGRLVQPRGPDGCVHRTGTNRCARGRAVTSPEDLVVSPDGRHVYVAAYGSHAVAVFARSRRTGVLDQLPRRRGCVRHGRGRGCASGRALAAPSSIAISPDGRSVYVAASGSDALSVFARDRRTGALRQLPGALGCFSVRPGGGCTAGRALNEPTSVAVSPDGRRVYLTSRRFPSGVAIFARAPAGSLTQTDGTGGCVSHRGGTGCSPARAISAPEEVLVSPDGRHVLVAGSRSNSVAVLRVGPDGLSQAAGAAGCISQGGTEGCAAGKALRGPVDLAISPDGRSVFTASSSSDGIAALRRNRTTGALTQSPGRAGCISQGPRPRRCVAGRGLDEVWGVAASPDGRNVYAVSSKVNTLGAMARDPESGALAQLPGRLGCFIRAGGFGCPEGRGLTVAVAVAVSPDGRNVYVASEDAYLGSIAIFRRLGR